MTGSLWSRLRAVTESATHSGALEPIATETRTLPDAGIEFRLRVATNLAKKSIARVERPRDFNPFLPHEPALWVADLPPAHRALLNKFPVLEHHLLIVTREFEDQETPLTPGDFKALWACLSEVEGLAFYNGGTVAGASQRHKHLQLAPDLQRPPIAHAVATLSEELGSTDALPFTHTGCRLPTRASSADAHARYAALQQRYGSLPYNLLLTREWLLYVPRYEECFEGCSFNALAFAGLLFARDEAEAQRLAAHAPAKVLRRLSTPQD